MATGPDFICIGAQKAGTGWLYDQLRSHPDFWMPPLKELHYFDRLPDAAAPEAIRTVPRARTAADRLDLARQRSLDDRDRKFVAAIESLYLQPGPDLDGYGRLFEPKDESISGDITPGYSTLGENMIARIARGFPGLKIIFLARDPVERAWSQLSMYVRRGLIPPFDVHDLEQVTKNLERPEVQVRSYPSQIVRKWRNHISEDRFRIYFFDNLRADASGTRRAIVSFLGGDPAKESGGLPPEHNIKALKEKLPLPEPTRVHLARWFESEFAACAAELGGPALDWAARYRLTR